MTISDKGIALIKRFEGYRGKIYKCPGGKMTIGYGHTGLAAYKGNVLTEEDADMLLRGDLKIYENAINKYVWIKLKQNQFDALISLVYNIGISAFTRSTILRLINQNMMDDAAFQFLLWNKSRGRVLPGLARRRRAEKELFMMKETQKEDL